MKKLLIIPFFLLFLTINRVNAQQINPSPKLYINFSKVLGVSSVINTRVYPYVRLNYYPLPSVALSISADYRFTTHVGIEGGIRYSLLGSRAFYITEPTGDPMPDFIDTYLYQHYLEIPVLFNFFLGSKQLRGMISAGLSAAFYLQGNCAAYNIWKGGHTYVESNTLNSANNSNVNRIELFPSFAAGIYYSLSSQMGISIQPEFRMGVIPIFKENSRDYYPWSAGLKCVFHLAMTKK